MFIPSTFNGMEDYGNLLLMRLLLRFLSFLFHYFINEVRKTRKKLLNLQLAFLHNKMQNFELL